VPKVSLNTTNGPLVQASGSANVTPWTDWLRTTFTDATCVADRSMRRHAIARAISGSH
jgi:hypothetical protein